MRRALAATVLSFAVAVGAAGVWIARGLWTPADPDGSARTFAVGSGESLSSIARRLDAERLLPRRALFGPGSVVLLARILGVDRQVKSGEYDLSPEMTPVEILNRIVSGNVKTYPVTIPEGLRIDEVAARIEAAGIASAGDFIARANKPEVARSFQVDADTLEGYLYPESYRFRRETPPDEILRRMVSEFRGSWNDEDRRQLAAIDLDLHQVVTLASIVEKETAVAEERPQIAAVFLNRLRRGMRLQSDPTVIYGIIRERGQFDGNIRRRDLQTDTAYNTYTRSGLPPGPVAGVNMESIRAVLNPANVKHLYFVSRNDGTHKFSSNLTDHVNAVNRYQRRRR